MSDFLLIAFPAACFTACTVIVVCACVTAGKADERLQGFTRDSPPVTPLVLGTGSRFPVPGQGGGMAEWDFEAGLDVEWLWADAIRQEWEVTS